MQVNKGAVESIRNTDDLKRVRSTLNEQPRDLLLFDLATQTGIRMKELLTLRVKDLLDAKVGERIPIFAGMQSDSSIIMSEIIHETFLKYLSAKRPKPDDYLFKSRKGEKPLNLSSVSNMVKGWFERSNIQGIYGARYLHKIWECSNKNESPSRPNFRDNADSMKFLQPIETFSVQETIYRRLFEAIISGKIPPGARLTVAQISKRFEVSPTPVRVALNWLEARGFVISQKKKASIVKELSIANLKEIMTLRLALEILGAELSCESCTEETLTRLESLLEVYEKTNNLDEFQETNNQFHQTLCKDANMPLLQQLISDLCHRVSPYLIIYILNQESVKSYRERNLGCHRRIYEGMRQKDPEEVCKWLKADLSGGITRLEEVWNRNEGVACSFRR